MLVVLVWIIALVLAIPTYGISIVVAIFINIALTKVANSALTTASVLTNENIPIDVKIQQLYLNYCQTVHHKTFYSWQYNRDLLLEALGYAMKRLDGDQILSFDVVYAYQKSKGLNSGDRIDYDFLDFIILDIKRMMKFHPKNKAELEKLIKNQEINLGDIDTRAITDMSKLFYMSWREDFSGIENWDVSNVTDMSEMFAGCTNFNQPLNNWDVSSVTDMSEMFGSVIDTNQMFYGCENFNQPLNNWDVSSVTDMSGMFAGCKNFNQQLNSWDVSSVTNMSEMFSGCDNFNQPLNNWDVSSVTDMSEMFAGCTNFNQPLYNWLINNPNADKIINEIYGYGTFEKARATIKPINGKYHPKYKWQLKLLTLDNSVNLGDIDTSAITDMSELFYESERKDFSGIENWDVSSVTDMSDMFRGCENFNQPLNNWDVSNVTNMSMMFYNCKINDENKPKFNDNEDDEIPF
ncbi:BspA family leucine-rich repeat surface protein [Campylobacter lanienae]|uniref:BspA family leucine-rich repeat surface protein n=1 Tax=Campylobacter lanienae TaxID=75658 RepID=UPI0021C49B57|nr:BspA family leucine-rich repeat surface protein [Campylobacter lanienae]